MAQKSILFDKTVINGIEKYVCEEIVSSDYALHIEREEKGKLYFYVRSTPEGEYCRSDVNSFLQNFAKEIFDYDFSHLVYPKYVKIVSDTPVVSASLITTEL